MAKYRYRLEGDTRASEVESGLQARVADALWMLARQWQVGEFRGEDAASPVQVRYQLETTPVSGLRDYRSSTYTPVDPFVPLEACVEQQPPGELAGFWRSAEAGMHLLRLLAASGLEMLRAQLRRDYPLAAPPLDDAAESAWTSLLLRRACDGERIYHQQAAVMQALRKQLAQDQLIVLDQAMGAWGQWYDTRLTDSTAWDCWDPERMEYRFEVRASTASGVKVLEAAEYPGGHLDWYNFDIHTASTKLPVDTQRHPLRTVLPAPVRFAGMATSRWWEMEDGTISFGDINSSSVDFARMITAAFAAGCGDNWFVMPARVPIGSLARVVTLEVRSAFGEMTSLEPIASLDGPGRTWRYFELKGDEAQPLLFVPAVALGRLEGPAVETVTLIRDETENLAWGIESAYEGVLERSIERMKQWNVQRVESTPPAETDLWQYRLLNPVPPHWIPFVPVRTGPSAQVRLRRGRMSEWDLLPPALVGIRGHTLLPDPAAALLLYEEEVPGSGVEITTAYQFARQVSGQAYVWLGRRKRPAHRLTAVIRETDAVLLPDATP